jgi:steroid 5-alpha reductase family enzyme
MSFPAAAWAEALPWAVGAVAVVLAGTFVASRRAGKHSVIDVAWGLLFVAITVSALVTSIGHGDPLRRGLLFALPVAWGLRLASHIAQRTRGAPEDPRYERLLARAPGNPDWYAVRMIYLLQGALALVVAAPVLVGMFEPGAVGVLAWVGVALWAVGVFFEAVGDLQLRRFRADPSNRGTIMDRGLWRYTRHPNYFGDACVWWGIFLVAAQRWPGVLTIPAPILMTLLLTRGSGVRVLEAHMRDRPGWADYARRTSPFFPLPPRRR